MLIVKLSKNKNINQALKEYKRKVRSTKLIKELRERKHYTKPSALRRLQKNKAIMKRKFEDQE